MLEPKKSIKKYVILKPFCLSIRIRKQKLQKNDIQKVTLNELLLKDFNVVKLFDKTETLAILQLKKRDGKLKAKAEKKI